jgi:hypothetical protein
MFRQMIKKRAFGPASSLQTKMLSVLLHKIHKGFMKKLDFKSAIQSKSTIPEVRLTTSKGGQGIP